MVTCSSCAQENPAGARFCCSCGRPIGDDELAPREERRVVTVLFVDMVAFTSRAERLDPEDLGVILRSYHDRVRLEIESFGGITEKFIGDAVVGIFGAPTAFGDDPERAVRAALAVRTAIAELNRADEALDLHVRIGVNTGDALVTVGARPELGEGMVTGDVVNMAARLQQNAPADGILAGLETYACTRDAVTYGDVISIAAKGKSTPLEARAALAFAGRIEPAARRPLVGRDREMQHLRQIWAQTAASSTPHVVTVLAPPGVGKTRLSVEFSGSVKDAGGRVVRGRSLPYRESSAYGAFATQVKQLAGIFESDSREVGRAKLDRIVECLGAADGDAVARHLGILLGLEPEQTVADRETLFFSVRCFIEAVAEDRPTLLVFEDLHWADPSLLDLVEMLGARLRGIPIVLLVLARPELLDARPGWGGGLPAYTAISLQPLGADESRKLADELLGGSGTTAPSALAHHVSATAEGNPLFIEQLAAVALERAEHALRNDVLPTTIRGIVTARLDALPREEHSVLLNAAVVGKVFWRGALRAVADDAGQVGDALSALERRDLIRRDRGSAIEGERQYTFTHVLIRDAAYDMLTRPQRRERHRRVAHYLEEETPQAGETAAQLARHWREAGEADRAVEQFVTAAEQAGRGWAKQHAVELYKEALDLSPEGSTRHAEIGRQFALAYSAAWHVRDVRGQRLGPAAPDPRQTSG
jgi:class 3 adenylate cyclase